MASALHVVQQLFPEVTSVRDSRRSLRVEVQKRDINSATVRNHKACAVAVACKRMTRADGVIVSVSRAYLIRGKEAVRFNVPRSVAREVVVFDRGGEFAVGTYQLDAVPKRERIGVRKHGIGGGGGKPNGNLAKRFKKAHHKTENIRASLGSKHAA